MSFLTFLMYFAASMVIYDTALLLIRGLLRTIVVWKFKRDVKSGKIKLVTAEQAFGPQKDEDDIKWN